MLRTLGVDEVQGSLLSQPMPSGGRADLVATPDPAPVVTYFQELPRTSAHLQSCRC